MAAWTAATVSTSDGAPSSKRSEAGMDEPARPVARLTRWLCEPFRESSLILPFLLSEATYVGVRPFDVGIFGVRTQEVLDSLGPGGKSAQIILTVL